MTQETMLGVTQAVAAQVAVVMVPLPAHGHLNSLLNLSRSLAGRRGISVHYFAFAPHIRQVRGRSSDVVDEDRFIRFHDVPLSIASAPPNPHVDVPEGTRTASTPMLQPAFNAILDLRAPLAALCRTLATSARRVVVIHDTFMPLAAEVAGDIPGAEAYCFNSINVIGKLCIHWAITGKPIEEAREELDFPYMLANGGVPEAFSNFYRRQFQSGAGVISGHIFNSCYAFEGRFIDLLKRDGGREYDKSFAVGPLNSFVSPTGAPRDSAADHECLRWLDEQPPASVVYVSFGTTGDLTGELVAQLAAGLEASGHRFLWVIRDVDRAVNSAAAATDQEGHDKLPPGFCQRNEGVGKVVRSWAPQREILAHPSTGAFLSHCGTNSMMESFAAGVPILAWPMLWDQPMYALLVTHVLGVGLTVRDWAKGEAVVPAATVSDAIKRLMGNEEGREVRRKAMELGVEVRRAFEEDGSSTRDLDAFVALIGR